MTAVEEPITAWDRKDLTEYIGWHIRFHRLGLSWTQEDLAAMVDKHKATIAGWESGHRVPSVADLVAVAEAMDIEVARLLPRRFVIPVQQVGEAP